jgi:hypothetical protein
MSTFYGSNMLSQTATESDTLLMYDFLNNKSYVGKPTTNLVTNGAFAGGVGVAQETGSNPVNEIVQFPNPGDSPYCLRSTAVGGSTSTEYEMDFTGLTANTTYVISCWVGWDQSWNGTYNVTHARWYTSSGGEGASWGGTDYVICDTKVVGNVIWNKVYKSFTVGSDTNGNFNWYLGYTSDNTAGYRYFTNLQLEVGSYPTPFVNGSRTIGQSVLDLKHNTTFSGILSYQNSLSALPYFNGPTTYNYVTATDTWSHKPGNNFTYECLVYLNGDNGYDKIIVGKSGGNVGLMCWNSTVRFRLNASGFQDISYAVNLNTWYHLVGTYSSAVGSTLYVNGVSVGTNTITGALADYGDTLQIGGNINQNYSVNGYINIARVYNRILSTAEVSNNYNALKGRMV